MVRRKLRCFRTWFAAVEFPMRLDAKSEGIRNAMKRMQFLIRRLYG